MPDNQTQNNTTNNQTIQNNTDTQQNNNTNNTQNNQSNMNMGGGKTYAVGMDTNQSSDMNNLEKFCQALQSCGNTVEHTQIGPNQESYLPELAKKINADTCVFLCALAPATIWSFGNAVKAGTFPHTIFGIEGWVSSYKTIEDVRNAKWTPEHDAGQFMGASEVSKMESEAKTVGEWIDNNSQYISICCGATPEELASNICSGKCGGGGGSGSVVDSGGGAQIKDKTFEHCIRRICAATDSIFLVDNNVAVLFPYTDWLAFTLRQRIDTIHKKEIDPNVFAPEYNNEGFYNKVSVAWGGTTLPKRFDDNKTQTSQTFNNTNSSDTKNTIANLINVGFRSRYDSQTNTVNVPQTVKINKGKTTQEISVDSTGETILSEQYDALVEKYGVLEKRVESKAPDLETAQYIANALLIQYVRDFNNTCRCRALTNKKYNGGTFHAVQNPFTEESELFYLDGYNVRLKKREPIYHDLDFRYGPESAEELADYQTFGGGKGSSNASMGAGSATEEQIWQGTQKACHQWTCGELRTSESDTSDPQVAEDFYNKNVQAGKKFCFSCYGMSSWLYYQFNYKANIPCRIIGGSDHHVVELFKNNEWYKPIKEYSKYCEEGYHYNDYCKGNAPVVLDAPNNIVSVGGNTGDNK